MHLYKRSRTWWCWYYDAAKRRRCVSTKCTDRRAAELAAARLEREAADPRHHAAYQATLRAALERLLTDREALVLEALDSKPKGKKR